MKQSTAVAVAAILGVCGYLANEVKETYDSRLEEEFSSIEDEMKVIRAELSAIKEDQRKKGIILTNNGQLAQSVVDRINNGMLSVVYVDVSTAIVELPEKYDKKAIKLRIEESGK